MTPQSTSTSFLRGDSFGDDSNRINIRFLYKQNVEFYRFFYDKIMGAHSSEQTINAVEFIAEVIGFGLKYHTK